ncbi:hypothetical protein HHI36_001516 [Cryptolaemus montrouzieri]|uniref:Uncharacterized protein n=1 Tax=Cryptolaemus montrouzieri TaxID=559131 RepID=A0ABD2P962_9CUCU
MSRSYEEEMKHLQKLYELTSNDDIDVADPYADCNTSDEYEPSESKISNDDYKVLPKKANRLMKHLQKLYELKSNDDIDVADPYADCNTSDEYESSESKISNDDCKVLPKKANRLKKSEVNESTQDGQPGVSNCAKSSNGSVTVVTIGISFCSEHQYSEDH